MTIENSKMKILSILVLFNLLINIDCNPTNSTTNLSIGSNIEFSSRTALNETEEKDFSTLSPVENQTFLINSNNTIFIIENQPETSSVNTNQSFVFSTDTSSPNSQIETDLIKEENTTPKSRDQNVSSVVFETEDLNTEPQVFETTSDKVDQSSDFTTTTLDEVNKNLDFETTTLSSTSDNSDSQTETSNTVSESSDFGTTVVSERSNFESTSDKVSKTLDFETTTSGSISENSHFETTTLETVSEGPVSETTLETASEGPVSETTLGTVSERPFSKTTSDIISQSFESKRITPGIKARDFKPKLETRSPFKLFCGYGSWASHRMGEGKLDVEGLNSVEFVLERCTHLIYAFAGLNSSADVMSLDPTRELDPNSGTFAQLRSIKERHPHIKTLIAVGGWDTPSDLFSFLISNERMRSLLTQTVPHFAKRHGFDGVVISWFYPGSQWRGGHPMDKQNFATFLQVFQFKKKYISVLIAHNVSFISTGVETKIEEQ